MDQWEALLESHDDPPDVREFSKLLQVAGNVSKMDLADFEFDWFLQTLLYKPISLLNTVRLKRLDDAWSKPIGDTFKLLTELVEKVPQRVEPWIEDIVQTCDIPLDARSRVYALGCLTACVKRRALDPRKYIAALQDTSACRAPMAILVGSICEYHPETVADDAVNIWRIYLNILDSNKNTDTIINAVLQGISGLFKHFGMDLPVVELTKFYQKLSRDYIKISKCENIVLSILQNYSVLFKQVLSRDSALRMYIWSPDCVRVAPCIYRTVATELKREEIQKILTNEILPHTTNSNASIKYTALRISYDIKKTYNIQTELSDLDVYTLEFDMRNEVSYYATEAISYCIDCKLPNSEKVLQSAILFYNNLPINKRRDIVVNGILQADNELMIATLNYIVTESCQPDALPTFLPLWKDILQSELKEKIAFFVNYVKNFIFVLDLFMEGDEKIIPEKLTTFLVLTSHVFTLTPPEDYTADQSALVSRKMAELATEYGVIAPLVAVVRSLICHLNDDGYLIEVFEMFEIDRCKDEALLCELSLALIYSPKIYFNFDRILLALEVIFSRKDAEPATLGQALRKLEDVILTTEHVDDGRIHKIITLVEKLRNRKDLIGKEARILNRDVAIFLGKYSKNDINNNSNLNMNFAIDLKEKLTLDIPYSNGETYKINLSTQVIFAIEEENYEMLNNLLCVVCSHPLIQTEPYQKALGAIIARCGRGENHAGVSHAQLYCGTYAMNYIVQLLTHSTPGTRKLLCDVIEGILLKDSRNSELISKVAEKVVTLISSRILPYKQAGLDLLQSLFQPLKENNEVTKKTLLKLLILVTTTNESDTFLLIDEIKKLLKEKIELFDTESLEATLNTILSNLLKTSKNNLIAHTNFTNLVKSTIELVYVVCESKRLEIWAVIGALFDSCQNDIDSGGCLKMAAELAGKFDGLISNEFLEMKNGFLERILFDFNGNLKEFQLEMVLSFLNTFVSVLLEFHRQQTKEYINNLIKNIKPKQVVYLRKKLCIFISKYTEVVDIKSLVIWLEKQPLDTVTSDLESNQISGHFEHLTAVRILLEILKVKDPAVSLTYLNGFAQKWPRMVLRMFAAGFLKHLTVELSFLTDLLAVSLRFLTVTDLKKLVLEGHNLRGVTNEKLGLEFCVFFIDAFYEYFLRKPFVLFDEDMSECAVILNDVVRIVVRKRSVKNYDDLFELIEGLWPKYAVGTEFAQKQKLLLDMSFLSRKLSACSKPIQWAMSVMNDENADVNEKVLLVGVLPGGEACSDIYRKYASVLPTRLSELNGTNHSVLRSLLDATSIQTDNTLLDIVITRAAGDPTPGWWDTGFSSCMASVAISPDVGRVYNIVYGRCWEGISVAVCVRLLVPLIRFSTPTTVTFFVSTKLQELCNKLRHQKSPANHYLYHKYVADCVRVLSILLVVIEKVPPHHLESPTSPLYTHTQTDKPWHLVRELCKLCVTLRDKVKSPDGASQELGHLCRTFQTTVYNCLCACITVWKPDEKLYKTIFDLNAWEKVSNSNEEYKLPIRAQWNTTSVSMSTSVRSSSTCTSARTRLFLRTLSENPLLYDLIDDFEEEQVETQQILVPSTELNSHPCAPTVTSLLLHSAERNHTVWLEAVDTALKGGSRNCRWLLAQAICNTKEELKTFSVSLAPGLLATIADTAVESNGRKLLNGLHIDIINTLIQWGDVPNPNLTHTNTCTECLIHTCVSNRDKKSVFRSLLDVFSKFLDVFGKYISVEWSVFQNYVDDPAIAKSTVPILTKLSKSKINIPELLPNLLSKLSNYHDNQLAKLSELLGFVIRNDHSRPDVSVTKLFDKFRKNSVNDYVKLVYYSKYCDEQQFRVIVDLTQKLPPGEKNKCIKIIHMYLEEHPGSELVEELASELRSLIDEKCGGKRFEDFFTPRTSEPLQKKPRLTTPSIILNTIGNNERYFNKLLNDLDATSKGLLLEKLCMDMGVRLVECFYISIYLPIIYPNNNKIIDLSVCLSSFYDMLFYRLKSDDKFKQAKLTETAFENERGQSSKILTKTKTYIGSLRSYSYKSSRKHIKKETKSGFCSELFVKNILDTLIMFTKVSMESSLDLLKQSFISIKSNEFDSFPIMAEMLSKIINKETKFLEFSRLFAQDLCEIDGIFDTMEALESKTVGTDVEFLVKLLNEDLKLRKYGPEQFILGISFKDDITDISMRDDSEEFSIEELVSAFHKLSNWDDLTLQQKDTIENTGIPLLWTSRDHFDELINDYTETESWFGKMVSLNRNKKQDSLKWLREAERSPRRYFDISAITEGIQWQDDIQTKQYDCRINNRDCIVEWAARLMIRSSHLSRNPSLRDENISLSRSHELIWCKRAIEMALPNLALQCIKRNTEDLYDTETLQWLEQKVDALKVMGIKGNDSQLLRKALDTADKYTPLFQDNSTCETILKMKSLIIELSYRLELLNYEKLNSISNEIEIQFNRLEKGSMSFETKKRLQVFFSNSILFYDDLWKGNSEKSLKNNYIKSMLSIIQRSIDLDIDLKEGFLSIFFNNLESCHNLDTDVAVCLKEMVTSLIKAKNTQFIHILKTKLLKYHLGLNIQEVTVKKYTLCLQLVADPDFTLLRYCTELCVSVRNGDINQYNKLFARMKVKIFENPYLGTDYQTLLKYKTQLYELDNLLTDSGKTQSVLKSIIMELQEKRAIPSLRLSQLCPALTDLDDDNGLKELLGLDEDVIKFEEQIQVYTDSIGRPCILTAILKNGVKCRYLVKQADMWQAAAALTVAGSYPVSYDGYKIIPLSEDCGLIQFLENHIRVRELISKTFEINEVPILRQSTKEDELILPPTQTSVSHHNQICTKIPPYLLRSAVENKCSTVQDFIHKKNKYLDTLCNMTIFNYIFGLGDRHLENILYNTQNGGLQCIDLDGLLQYGDCELPPARLTRNILSLVDSKVFESRLQSKMAALRDCQRFLTAVIKFCFQNDDQDFIEKFPYIEAILKGTQLSYEITKDVIKKSDRKYKEKYIQLLDEIFENFEIKNEYTIEEQVSSLLLQSTDPRILSIVRSGWEPWI